MHKIQRKTNILYLNNTLNYVKTKKLYSNNILNYVKNII